MLLWEQTCLQPQFSGETTYKMKRGRCRHVHGCFLHAPKFCGSPSWVPLYHFKWKSISHHSIFFCKLQLLEIWNSSIDKQTPTHHLAAQTSGLVLRLLWSSKSRNVFHISRPPPDADATIFDHSFSELGSIWAASYPTRIIESMRPGVVLQWGPARSCDYLNVRVWRTSKPESGGLTRGMNAF